MADRPSTGDTDWGTKANAHDAVGHNNDGTHNQEDWLPILYADEESITFPHGLIMKTGTKTVGANTSETVTFGTVFPTAIKSVVHSISSDLNQTGAGEDSSAHTQTTTNFVMENRDNEAHDYDWIAIGY